MSLIVTLEQSHPQGPRHAQVGMIAISAVAGEPKDDEDTSDGVTINFESILAPLGVKPADILDIQPKQTVGQNQKSQAPVVLAETEIKGQYKIKSGSLGEEGTVFWVFYHPNSPMTNV